MRVWKQLSILLGLCVVGAGGFVAYNSYVASSATVTDDKARARQVTVEIEAVTLTIMRETVEAVGTTRARKSVDVKPLSAGTVVEVSFAPGQLVEAGAILARLDDDIQRADLAEAQAKLTERRQTLARMQQLRRRNAVAKTSLEQAVAEMAVAEAAMHRTNRRLEDRSIRAPIQGIVGLTDIEVGTQVDTDTMVTRVDDLSEVEVAFSLPERLYGSIALGRPITAQSAAFRDREFAGNVTAIDSRVDPVGRSFKLRATVPNPDSLLPAGMFMAIVLTLSEQQVLVVPEEAIVVQAADTYVFVADAGKAKRQPVVTGQRRNGAVAIMSGVTEGQKVITRGLQRLRDGASVKILGEPDVTAAPTQK